MDCLPARSGSYAPDNQAADVGRPLNKLPAHLRRNARNSGAHVSESTADLSATALLEAYRTGALSPVTATRDALDRIEGCNGSVNAFCHVDAESALASAEESAARWRADT